jgi:murein DD-endopeptidase MepM/ murein hydrolase activator NlpD
MKVNRWINFFVLTAALCFGGVETARAAEPGKMLNVFTRSEGGVTHFFVQNLQVGTVTVTFDMQLKNMGSSTNFPCTAVVAGNQTAEVFTLKPLEKTLAGKYSFTRSSVIGSAEAVPDDSCVYLLPYAAGASFRVSQGYHGAFSHTGPDEYAIDWGMPEGTPVHAAREGLVVQAKDDMDRGGASPKYEKFANCVMIQHPDGTVGIYGHLKKGGCQVKVGDYVQAGEVIALSGNTGYSNGPHLHFAVFKARNGYERESLPVKFRGRDGAPITLAVDHSYEAAPIEVKAAANNAGQLQAHTD